MKDNTTTSFGLELQRIRESRNLTLEEVAADADMTVETLSRIERPVAVPDLTEVRQLARALDTPLVELLIATGQLEPDDMPSLRTYLHTTRNDLPLITVTSVEQEIQTVLDRHGVHAENAPDKR
jgi:transcriptional regulator with XRE-family HTH domain